MMVIASDGDNCRWLGLATDAGVCFCARRGRTYSAVNFSAEVSEESQHYVTLCISVTQHCYFKFRFLCVTSWVSREDSV